MRTLLGTAAALAAAASLASLSAPAAAQDCTAGKAGAELSLEEAASVYDCLAEAMFQGYQQGDKHWIPEEFVAEYRDWQPTGTGPAAPGPHGDRFLLTWVNDVGFEAYTEFATEDAQMPAGTIIAKESFEVGEDGAAKAGPLFLMQKVGEGLSPETEGWWYMMVAPNGEPQAVEVMSACNECHSAFGPGQDFLGYPVEEVRVSN